MKNRGLIVFLVVLVILLSTLAAGLLFVVFSPKNKIPVGNYERYFELDDTAVDKAKAFLSEAVMGDEVSFSPGTKADSIRLLLSVDESGVLKRSIDPESYEEAREALTEELTRAFRSLIALRIEKAGFGSLSDEEIDDLFEQEFGVSIAGYLAEYGPELLPPLEELSGRFDATARCRSEDGNLVFPDGTKIAFLRNDDLLVLQYESGETEVYSKVPSDGASDGSSEGSIKQDDDGIGEGSGKAGNGEAGEDSGKAGDGEAGENSGKAGNNGETNERKEEDADEN